MLLIFLFKSFFVTLIRGIITFLYRFKYPIFIFISFFILTHNLNKVNVKRNENINLNNPFRNF